MTDLRRQAQLDAPIGEVWQLVGDPRRYPDWWPEVIEVRGERIEEGAEFLQVTKTPLGKTETTFLIERLDELREVFVQCRLSGSYAHFKLTEAMGGTFVELALGMDPTAKPLRYQVYDRTLARTVYRRWTEETLAALRRAATALPEPRDAS